jgi:hypothetical protein
MLSSLSVVLIALALVELGLVAWTVNFLRRYAFRPNAAPVQAHGLPHRTAGMGLAGGYRAPRPAANQAGDLVRPRDEAKRH